MTGALCYTEASIPFIFIKPVKKGFITMKAKLLLRALTLLLSLTLLPLGLIACRQDPPPVEQPDEKDPTNNVGTPDPGEPDPDPDPVKPAYKYVVVLGVDGAGAFFEKADTPFIDSIFQSGAITYSMLSENPTISAQCWGAMLHGVTSDVHGLTNSIVAATPYPTDSRFPSVFRVIRENDPEATLASFSHWNPINVGIIEDGLGVHKDTAGTDKELTQKIVSYLKKQIPTFLFVQFDDVDAAGHANGYGTPAQLNKISEIDTYIADIYDTYDKLAVLHETLFIVTADHGGSGTSHGGLTNTEKYVMFAATGETVTAGEIEDMEIRDTAAVVLHALGYDLPDTWTARVPSGLFEGVEAGERPVWVDKESPRYHETQPTPAVGSEAYITSVLPDANLLTYLTFDGTVDDDMGGDVTAHNKLYFVENGYFGQSVAIDDGYISLEDYKLGKDSFTLGFWIKTSGSVSDPPILSNKNWASGLNPGFVLVLRDGANICFNAGNGSSRLDFNYPLPSDYRTGWMHVLLIADREAGTISLCYDFGKLSTLKIPAALQNATFDALSSLNIGQDGTGNYDRKLAAELDELMIFEGALSQKQITALASYYGKERDASATEQEESLRDHTSTPTPTPGSDKYVTNFLGGKELSTYLTFDGTAEDATGTTTTKTSGSVTYADGFFGQGAYLKNGYVSIEDYAPGKDSFTIALWIKTPGVSSDPAIFSNKDWQLGTNNGFILSLRGTHDVKFNMGNGSARQDKEIALPYDYQSGWMHLILVVDREKGEIRVSIDFGAFVTIAMSDAMKAASADAFGVLNIGQDGTGNYPAKLDATVDEFMIIDGALTQEEVAALQDYDTQQ